MARLGGAHRWGLPDPCCRRLRHPARRGWHSRVRPHSQAIATALRDALCGNPWMPPIPYLPW